MRGGRTDDPGMATGDNIRAERVRKGMSRIELADASGLSTYSIERLETGQGLVNSHAAIWRIGTALGVDPCALIDPNDQPSDASAGASSPATADPSATGTSGGHSSHGPGSDPTPA